jgi:hypothetical protein
MLLKFTPSRTYPPLMPPMTTSSLIIWSSFHIPAWIRPCNVIRPTQLVHIIQAYVERSITWLFVLLNKADFNTQAYIRSHRPTTLLELRYTIITVYCAIRPVYTYGTLQQRVRASRITAYYVQMLLRALENYVNHLTVGYVPVVPVPHNTVGYAISSVYRL